MKFVEFSKQTGRQLTEEAALDMNDSPDDIESNIASGYDDLAGDDIESTVIRMLIDD